MSIQEMKSRIHQLVDDIDDEVLLEEVNATLSKQPVSLTGLSDEQRIRLEKAIRDHREGKTFTNEEMKQRYDEWLIK